MAHICTYFFVPHLKVAVLTFLMFDFNSYISSLSISANFQEAILTQTEEEIVKNDEEEINRDSPTQLTQSSALEQEAG